MTNFTIKVSLSTVWNQTTGQKEPSVCFLICAWAQLHTFPLMPLLSTKSWEKSSSKQPFLIPALYHACPILRRGSLHQNIDGALTKTERSVPPRDTAAVFWLDYESSKGRRFRTQHPHLTSLWEHMLSHLGLFLSFWFWQCKVSCGLFGRSQDSSYQSFYFSNYNLKGPAVLCGCPSRLHYCINTPSLTASEGNVLEMAIIALVSHSLKRFLQSAFLCWERQRLASRVPAKYCKLLRKK